MSRNGHHRLSCHTCKSQLALGGSKRAGSLSAAHQRGWVSALTKDRTGLLWFCPPCARKHLTKRVR